MRSLILGGARSGKSAYAESLTAGTGKELIYIATGHADDGEMAARIAHHRQQRSSVWTTVEEPIALGDALVRWCTSDRVVLVDCLTLWLTNLLCADGDDFPEVGAIKVPALFHEQRAHFLQALEQVTGDVVLVSNEVGLGVVPVGAISRCFADEAGRLNQAVAARCERVVLVAAGLPLALKGKLD